MEYMARIKDYVGEHLSPGTVRSAALTGLAAVVLATSVAGCLTASRRRVGLSLVNFEYEDIATRSKDPNNIHTTLTTPPKSSTTVDAATGKGFGFSYTE